MTDRSATQTGGSATRPTRLDASGEPARPGPLQRVRQGLSTVTSAGWATAALAVVSWVVGWRFGWNEFMVIATAAAVCLIVGLAFMFGLSPLRAEVAIDPQRVVVGRRAAGHLLLTNPTNRRTLPTRVELVVGQGAAEFDVPSLSGGEQHEELFVLPTERRGIIAVGPATSVRSDPLGLLRRSVPWTEPMPLFVHPRTVPMGHLGAGFMRDLEGQTTPDLSPSDIAFHALREYASGDDRRFVHWMTTARVGRLMVRQFTDTRRAHLAVIVDAGPRSYGDASAEVSAEFETAVSVAGSLGVRAIADEQDLTVIVDGHSLSCASAAPMLDGLAGVELGGRRSSLVSDVDVLLRNTAGISLAILITGSRAAVADLRAATMRFPSDVRTVAIRVDPDGESGIRPVGSTVVLTVSDLDELTRLMLTVTQ